MAITLLLEFTAIMTAIMRIECFKCFAVLGKGHVLATVTTLVWLEIIEEIMAMNFHIVLSPILPLDFIPNMLIKSMFYIISPVSQLQFSSFQ